MESIIYESNNPEALLGKLWGKIDELDNRTMILEENQFSTTTKIDGNATLGITSVDYD